MCAKRISTRRTPKDAYRSRWQNAQERRAAMEQLLAINAYDPALVLAVQAVIAASDALTIYHLETRSASDRHHDAVEILSRVREVEGIDEAIKHLSRVLRDKESIEYSGDPVKPQDAERIAEHARRFIDFVARSLPH